MVRAVTLYQGPQSYAGCGIHILVRSPIVARLREAYSLHWRRHPHAHVLFFLFSSLYQAAAYAMGKHVPGGNLFPTVRTQSTTTKVPTDVRVDRVYLSTTDRSIDRTTTTHRTRRTRVSVDVRPTYRPIDRPTDRTSTDACTVLLPE